MSHVSADELLRLAGTWNLTLSEDMAGQFGRTANDLLAMLEALVKDAPASTTPVAATREVGNRPPAGQDPLNAIVRNCRVAAAEPGSALAGMRLAIKDSIAVADVPLTLGSAVLDDFVPNIDAVVIDRVLRAGAEVVAITNMDCFAFSGGGDSSAFGPTLNPFDRTRTAGGSSGGSAAALHYHQIDAALGTDQGGSIRAPAAWCGVLGLKPTHSLVPYTGIVGIDATFDHVGPITRSVSDMAELMGILAGADPSDPRQAGKVPTEAYRQAVEDAPDDLTGLRFGLVGESHGQAVDAEPAVVAAVHRVADQLRELGAEVSEVSVPEHLSAGPIAFAGFIEGVTATITGGGNGYHWRGRYWPELADALAKVLRERADKLSPQIQVALTVGRRLQREHAGSIYARAQNARPQLRAGYDRALADVDFLLMPTTPGVAHLHDPNLPLHEHLMRGWGLLANTSPTNMTGHPALSIPAAEAEGLAVGMMLIASHFHDARLLRVARTFERAFGWKPTTDF